MKKTEKTKYESGNLCTCYSLHFLKEGDNNLCSLDRILGTSSEPLEGK